MRQKEILKERLSHTIWFSNGQAGMCMDTACLGMILDCSSGEVFVDLMIDSQRDGCLFFCQSKKTLTSISGE